MKRQLIQGRLSGIVVVLVALVLLVTTAPPEPASAAGRCSTSVGGVEQRIGAFWQCVGGLAASDYLLAEDVGAWAQNVIDRDRSACIGVADFRASTGNMQIAIERASVGVSPSAPKASDIESRIAKFWQRVDSLGASDSLAATDVGQWGLNVIDRDPSRRIRVDDFQRSTASMQAAFDRAKLSPTSCQGSPAPTATASPAPTRAPTPTPTPTRAPTPTPTSVPVLGNQNPWGYDYSFGTLIFDPPATLCQYFACIVSFWNGRGYVIQCADGMLSLSGGIQGSCSSHDGNSRPLYSHVVTPTQAPLATVRVPSLASHYVSKNMGSGRYLLLDDKSVWKIDTFDRLNALLWSFLDEIVVVTDSSCLYYHLINTDQTEGACATYLGQAGRHTIVTISGDGQFIKLENGDIWQVDSFDRFDTEFWFAYDSITIAADRECLYGYRLIDTNRGKIACAQ
jgi:hypothetical protein